MPDLEHNIDELMRKAAEQYGLKPGESNWDSVVTQLLPKPSLSGHNTNKRNGPSKKYLTGIFMLLLLMLTDSIDNKLQNGKPIVVRASILENKKNIITGQQSNKAAYEQQQLNEYRSFLEKAPGKKYYPGAAKNADRGISDIPDPKKTVSKKNASQLSLDGEAPDISAGSLMKAAYNNEPVSRIAIAADTINETPEIYAGSTIPDDHNGDLKIQGPKKQNGFYSGVLAGIEMNTVKYQELKTPGFDIGIIAGYAFNRKFSTESGLLFSKKNYSSEGKYFSMDKVGASMPAGMDILYLEGSSNFLEIPINLRYNIAEKKNSRIFTSAGINSFIMTKENNKYLTQLDGVKETIESSYKNSAGYFAAAINLSAGYEFKAGRKNNIRIEPYAQIPLKGIGVGKLPVASMGLHAAFTFPRR